MTSDNGGVDDKSLNHDLADEIRGHNKLAGMLDDKSFDDRRRGGLRPYELESLAHDDYNKVLIQKMRTTLTAHLKIVEAPGFSGPESDEVYLAKGLVALFDLFDGLEKELGFEGLADLDTREKQPIAAGQNYQGEEALLDHRFRLRADSAKQDPTECWNGPIAAGLEDETLPAAITNLLCSEQDLTEWEHGEAIPVGTVIPCVPIFVSIGTTGATSPEQSISSLPPMIPPPMMIKSSVAVSPKKKNKSAL